MTDASTSQNAAAASTTGTAGPAPVVVALPEGVLESWASHQRWFTSKGSTAALETKGAWIARSNGVTAVGHLFIERSGSLPVLYQVPLTYRSHPLPDPEAQQALVGTTTDAAGDPVYVYDAPHDPAFAEILLELIRDGGATSRDHALGDAVACGHRQPGAEIGTVSRSHVLRGEQSNTSIIVDLVDGAGSPVPSVIVKIFRALHDGDNPDVTVQSALGAHGSTLVPASIGSITGEWDDSGEESGRASGHLAYAQEFLPGVRDADTDFTAEARELGRATAAVHADLAEIMETLEATPERAGAVVATMRRRLDIAIREVPRIAGFRDAVERVFALAEESPWPRLQRIHGDYHLGQVLSVPGRGWVLLDFEGEPLRPMHERRLPDVVLRDVAGMLRSFDYAAGAYSAMHPGETRAAWASAARRAFVDGYIERSGNDLREHREVLDAFELDKAVYETIYEARNRPDWLDIPVAAIERLTNRAAAAAAAAEEGAPTPAPTSPLDPLHDFEIPEDADLHVPTDDER